MADLQDLNALALPELFAALVDPARLAALVRLARDEDLGSRGDVTSRAMIPAERRARAVIAARAAGVVAGLAVVPTVIEVFEAEVAWRALVADGDPCGAGDRLGVLDGRERELLALERTLLNLLCRAAGVATRARRFVERTAGTRAHICDTRKTLPGYRGLDKYAARCGGAWLHRIGLDDAMLVKDNHVAGLGPEEMAARVAQAARAARQEGPLRFVEVEVDRLDQLDALLRLPAGTIDMILLDNMAPSLLVEAVRRRDGQAPGVLLEASGGVDLDSVRGIAETGVDRISVGSITHSAPALDLGLDLEGDASTMTTPSASTRTAGA